MYDRKRSMYNIIKLNTYTLDKRKGTKEIWNQIDFYYIITINIQTERKKEMWNQRGNYRKIIQIIKKQNKKENTEEFRQKNTLKFKIERNIDKTETRPVFMILS